MQATDDMREAEDLPPVTSEEFENAASEDASREFELAPPRAMCEDPSACEDYGLACVDGWEEDDDNCDVKCRIGCDGTYGKTSDAICQCSDTTEGAPPNHYYECGSGKGKDD